MNVGHTKQGRPEWYDRNPVTKTLDTRISGMFPPSHFVDVAYTVPSDRKAFLQGAQATVVRETASAPARDDSVYVSIHPLIAFVSEVVEGIIASNNVGDKDTAIFAGAGALLAGEAVKTNVDLFSTGGSLFVKASVWLVEYDN